MKSFLGFIFILLLLLTAAGVAVYYYYEKPVQDNVVQYVNISIAGMDLSSGHHIPTNYVIALDSKSSTYRNGTTLRSGFVLEQVPINRTIYIYNQNINNNDTKQEFYTDLLQISSFEPGPFRIEFDLIKPGNLSFSQDGALEDKAFNVTAISTGTLRNIGFCTKWSLHFITVTSKNQNFSSMIKPDDFSTYDKCYSTGISLRSGESFTMPFTARTFDTLDDSDSIEIVVFDSDPLDLSRHKSFKYKILRTDKLEAGGTA